ncbi:MAG: cytochrome P450 [Spongiibacteraceae bacterium]
MNKTDPSASHPAHIPSAAIYDFDMFRDAALFNAPHERVLQLSREAPPVFWTPHNGGHWLVMNYADVQTVLRTPEIFSSELIPPEQAAMMRAMIPAGAPRLPMLTPIMMDPPAHTKYRAPLQRAFSPKAITALQEQIATLAYQLIDDVIAQGHCEFIAAVAEQFPVRIFLKMMGLPEERLLEFRALAHEAFMPRERENEAMVFMQMRKIADAMHDVILARRENPQNDLISVLWSTEIDGAPMTMELMEDYCTLLFLAGLDTVVIAISFGMHHLARHPELQNQLRANPPLIADATEELLRRYTFTVPVRRVVQDTTLGGWDLKVGDRVMLYLPAADLDSRIFPNPEVFDVARENRAHMLFGNGPHHCVGVHLARLELQTLYRVVLERLPEFRLDPDKPAQYRVTQNLLMTSLNLRWD